MRAVAEDRVTDVIEMRDLHLVEKQAVLELAGVSEHRAVTDHDVLTDVRSMSDLTIPADPCRPLYHRAVFDHSAFADENIGPDERRPHDVTVIRRLEMPGQVLTQVRQRFPGLLRAIEDARVD